MKAKQVTSHCLLLMMSSWGAVALLPNSWGHDVAEPDLEKLPIWSQCCGEGDCVPQKLHVKRKEATQQATVVEIEGVQTAVDNEKFSPVPSNRTWVCYVNPRGAITNANIRCILYPQKSGTT